MKVLRLSCAVAGILCVAAAASAQPSDSQKGPVTDSYRSWYSDYAKKYLLAAAELMPEKDYAFRPTDKVRTFGELLDHVAETQQLFCGCLRGEDSPGSESPGNPKRTKAEVVKGLREAFAACDAVFANATDADLGVKVRLIGKERTKAFVFQLALSHMAEHYGNSVTYLRLKGLVAPSTKN